MPHRQDRQRELPVDKKMPLPRRHTGSCPNRSQHVARFRSELGCYNFPSVRASSTHSFTANSPSASGREGTSAMAETTAFEHGFDPEATSFTGTCYKMRGYSFSVLSPNDKAIANIGPAFNTPEECALFGKSLTEKQLLESAVLEEGRETLDLYLEECEYENGNMINISKTTYLWCRYPISLLNGTPRIRVSKGLQEVRIDRPSTSGQEGASTPARGFEPEATSFTGACYRVRAYSYAEGNEDDMEGSDLGPAFSTRKQCESYGENLTRKQIKRDAYIAPDHDCLTICVEEVDYENGVWQSSEEVGFFRNTYPVSRRGGKPVIQWSRVY